ncbi:MAG: hypothetical protein IT165_25325 [Bryobacterales bacterium]|nr:hypothetical protein [Bryobacterales bacterium]
MTHIKDPNAVLDYSVDWTRWLNGDSIATSDWTVPVGLTEVTDTHTGTKATVWLSGGTVGATYTVTNRITTTGGRTDDRSFDVKIAER